MNQPATWKDRIFRFGLFRFSIFLSFFLHFGVYASYYIATLPSESSFEDSSKLDDVELDWEEIPPELIGGTSSPAPVEKNDWVEGSNKDKNADAPDDSDINPNQLSGNGTDKDGFLFSYNGDRPPTAIINFDLRQMYPDAAKAANISSKTVVVLAQIDEKGQMQGYKIVSGRAGYGFDEAALQVMRRARFSPGYDNGKPTKMAHRFPIVFELDDD